MKIALFKTLFFITFWVIEYLALTPQHIEAIEGFWDKQNHFIAFFVLYILLSLSIPKLSALQKFGLLLLMGFQIEAMQYVIPGRFFSLMDIAADSIGIMISIAVCRLLSKICHIKGKQQ